MYRINCKIGQTPTIVNLHTDIGFAGTTDVMVETATFPVLVARGETCRFLKTCVEPSRRPWWVRDDGR